MKHLYPVVILAGGLATRLQPKSLTLPKSLMLVNQEPYINHQLRLLAKSGIREVIMCIGYLGEMIEEQVGNGERFGLKVSYVKDGPKLLGTAGAIKQALPLLGDRFFVLYGDSYLPCDYTAIQAAFEQHGLLGLMTVYHNKGQWDSSNVEFYQGQIINYDKVKKTSQMHYIDYGLGILKAAAFKDVPINCFYDLATLYQSLLQQKQLAGYEVKKRFYEVGSFAGINELEYYLNSHSTT